MRERLLFEDIQEANKCDRATMPQLSSRTEVASGSIRPEEADKQKDRNIDITESKHGIEEDEGKRITCRQVANRKEVPFSVVGTQKERTEASGLELIDMYYAQQGTCRLSGLPINETNMACDHIVPRESGGSDMIGNLQWLHTDVNNMKGTLEQSRFIALCRLIASVEKYEDDHEW